MTKRLRCITFHKCILNSFIQPGFSFQLILMLINLIFLCVCQRTLVYGIEFDGSFHQNMNKDGPKNEGCIMIDGICVAIHEVASYEAIKSIHAHLDDDHSGDIDLSESVDFLKEELNYTKGFEKRQQAFHFNDDQHVSVQEFWHIWLSNEVHNWTVEQTVGWLCSSVELSQYSNVFYENAINGSVLPRLAINTEQYLTRILGIKNPTHRSKISIKAMDIVLFGPPKDTGSLVKDMFIATLMLVICVLLFKFNRMSRTNNAAVKKMEQEMEILQEELFRFHQVKGEDNIDRTGASDLDSDIFSREKFPDSVSNDVPVWDTESDFPYMDTGTDLDFPQIDMNSKNELQLWLQLTYEKERVVLESKIHAMKRQLEDAREMCDKMKPNRKNLFGAFSFIHGRMEFKGQPVMEARSAFAEIQSIDKEMEYRWSTIERLLGASIIHNNPGVEHLQFILEPTLQASCTSSVNSTVGVAGHPTVPGFDTPSSIRSRISSSNTVTSINDDVLRSIRKAPPARSVTGASQGPAHSLGLIKPQRRSEFALSRLTHSYTVGSGLSAYEESIRGYGKDKKSTVHLRQAKFAKSKNGNHCSISSSTDDTDSGNYTVGDSEIRINSVRDKPSTKKGFNSIQQTNLDSPSIESYQRITGSIMTAPGSGNNVIGSVKATSGTGNSVVGTGNAVTGLGDKVLGSFSKMSLSDKMRLRRKRLEFINKSFSQDEKHLLLPEEDGYSQGREGIEKYSSEPSLENRDSSENLSSKNEKSSQSLLERTPFRDSKRKILGKSKLFSKFRNKSEKTKL